MTNATTTETFNVGDHVFAMRRDAQPIRYAEGDARYWRPATIVQRDFAHASGTTMYGVEWWQDHKIETVDASAIGKKMDERSAKHNVYAGGVYWHEDAPKELVALLARYVGSDDGPRLRLFRGDEKTGLDWNEEHDVTGRIGRSTGYMPTALLVNNARSMGGSALDGTGIVKVMMSMKPYRVLWQHPNYHTAPFRLRFAPKETKYIQGLPYKVERADSDATIIGEEAWKEHAAFDTQNKAVAFVAKILHCNPFTIAAALAEGKSVPQ